jgi:hypothetical protein
MLLNSWPRAKLMQSKVMANKSLKVKRVMYFGTIGIRMTIYFGCHLCSTVRTGKQRFLPRSCNRRPILLINKRNLLGCLKGENEEGRLRGMQGQGILEAHTLVKRNRLVYE